MFSTDIDRLRKSLSLNVVQRQILIGSLLGDGYLYPTTSGKYAYFRIAHGPKQESYVQWKYQFFKNFVLSPPRYQLQSKKRPKLGGYFWFKTIATPEFLRYRKMFYPEGAKIVPSNIGKFFDSVLSLAIWYMDDGCLNRKAVHLNTQGFSLSENRLLRDVVKKNFGISCNIGKSGNIGKGHILYIPTREAKRFLSLVDSGPSKYPPVICIML